MTRKQPFQFGLKWMFGLVVSSAVYAWLGRQYWLAFGPREGMIFFALGVIMAASVTRWMIWPGESKNS